MRRNLVVIHENILQFLYGFAWMFDPTNRVSPIGYRNAFAMIFDEGTYFSANDEVRVVINNTREALDYAVKRWTDIDIDPFNWFCD
jgi:hypothetical protein